MAATPEKRVKDKIVKILKEFSAYYFYPVSGGFGRSGVPDIVVCFRGRFIGIEVKADAKKNPPTALQEKNLKEIRDNGGVALVLDMHNYETIRETLRTIISMNDELNF